MNDTLLAKYAKLIVRAGANVQQGQTLVLTTPVDCAPFARLIAKEAYEAGAREVVTRWVDEQMAHTKLLMAADDIFDEFPEWLKDFYNFYARGGAVFVNISASDPDLMKDTDPRRMQRQTRSSNAALVEYRERTMSNRNAWCIVSVPTPAWAAKVFPGLSTEDAMERLWEAILKAVRVYDADPVAAWTAHKARLGEVLAKLNAMHIKSVRARNSLGTDLTLDLPQGHIWLGGADTTQYGIDFVANMPTEEVFTVPAREGVSGRVVASMPLSDGGHLIEGIDITFEAGRIVEFTAKSGYEALKSIVETDEGSRYLGELALVPHDSPISNLGLLFYNTLFDENAACHLAIGRAYPVCLEGGSDMEKDELLKAGVNDSGTHKDFMFGTADLEITAVTESGAEVALMRDGNYVF